MTNFLRFAITSALAAGCFAGGLATGSAGLFGLALGAAFVSGIVARQPSA